MHAVVAATFAAIFEPELVKLYEPPTPSATARTGCPHTTGTLLDWHNAATWNGAGVPSTAGASDAFGPCHWLHGECRNVVDTNLCSD